jgi:hypothetical protein
LIGVLNNENVRMNLPASDAGKGIPESGPEAMLEFYFKDFFSKNQ